MKRIAFAVLLVAAATGLTEAQAQDTTQVFATARKAELEAEAAIRKYAEFKPMGPSALQECDERIGRWCIYYEPKGLELPQEPGKVARAREQAIVALQKAFALDAARTPTVFPLLRLLIKSGRAPEALDVASAYLRAHESAEAHMVMGYALHHAQRTEEALQEFQKWLLAAPPYMRDKVDDIAWLLPPGMATRYRMSAPRLWRYADALYLTPANETLADHYSRHALAQMMAVRPIPSNGEPWGEQEEQMLVRFGPDVVVTRHFIGREVSVAQTFLGHWDNTAHTYFPPDFERVVQMRAPVDTLWPTDTLVGRSGHAPPTIRLMRSLQHQASVFPRGDTIVVAGATRTDKLSAGKALNGALFLLDDNFNVLARGDAVVQNLGDSLVYVAQMPVVANAHFFSAEVYDTESRFAARARFRLEPPAVSGGLALSGIMLTRPYPDGQIPNSRHDASAAPLSRPVVAPGQALGVYCELAITGEAAKSVNVELEIRPIEKPSAITRLAGWVGSRLGFAGKESSPGRLGWTLEVQPQRNNAIALTIDPDKLDRGRYLITLTVTDPASGAVVLAEREFLTR
ncbi:MAG TPA: tetratricopeptide repeat protein [Longimicrobiales bacterium]